MNENSPNPYAPPLAALSIAEPASGMQIASLSIRFGTYVADYIVSYAITLAVFSALVAAKFELSVLTSGWRYFAFSYGLTFVFYLVFESLFRRTPGKWIFGTRVVDRSGNPPSFEQIVKRSLARLIPMEPLSLFGSRPLGWHDSLSETRVVRTRGAGTMSPEESFAPPPLSAEEANRPANWASMSDAEKSLWGMRERERRSSIARQRWSDSASSKDG